MSSQPLQPSPPTLIIQVPSDNFKSPCISTTSYNASCPSTISLTPHPQERDPWSRILNAPEPVIDFTSKVDPTCDSNFRDKELAWEIFLMSNCPRPEDLRSRLPEASRGSSCADMASAGRSPALMPSRSLNCTEECECSSSHADNIYLDRKANLETDKSPMAYSPRFKLHEKYLIVSQAYDKEILSKLDSRRKSNSTTPPHCSARSRFSFPSHEISPSRTSFEALPQIRTLSVPNSSTQDSYVDSPSNQRLETPLSIYPANLNSGHIDRRSSTDATDSSRLSVSSGFNRSSNSFPFGTESLGLATRPQGACDLRILSERGDEFQDEAKFKQLQIEEFNTQFNLRTPNFPGKKRRASSPHDNSRSLHVSTGPGDLHQRRESTASRNSIGHLFHTHSGSISSTGSSSRTNSHASNLSLTPSSNTSTSSTGKPSPSGNSPRGFDVLDSPYATSISSDLSPRGSLSRPNYIEKFPSDNRSFFVSSLHFPDQTRYIQHSSPISSFHGMFVCDCCPKKPRRFETREELHTHEQEKQFECAYCRNRFKNKNEAERHQNSLHLRRQSWSCVALTHYAIAFHTSLNQPNQIDICGYCGEEFHRSGSGSGVSVITEQDWDIRIAHLTEIHKFGECNHSKKFFRADHFRQHLKHSHAGTSGKWTNMLESVCVKDEPFPEPIREPEEISPSGS